MRNGFAVKVRDSTLGKACMCGDRTFYLHVLDKNKRPWNCGAGNEEMLK